MTFTCPYCECEFDMEDPWSVLSCNSDCPSCGGKLEFEFEEDYDSQWFWAERAD